MNTKNNKTRRPTAKAPAAPTSRAKSWLDKDTERRLSKLGLNGVIAHWPEIDNLGVIQRIIEVEETDRKQRSLDRRIRSARIGKMKLIADFDWSWPDKIDRETIDDLFRLDFIDQASNVVLIGPNGIGKTMIAQNLAHAAVLGGRSALFVNAAALMTDLRELNSPSALARRLKHYAKPDLLVVDELGYLAAADNDGDLLFQLISRRYEKRSTIITTNKPFEEWNLIFPNSACTVALIERLVHHAEILVLDGESYRLKEAKEHHEARTASRNKAAAAKADQAARAT